MLFNQDFDPFRPQPVIFLIKEMNFTMYHNDLARDDSKHGYDSDGQNFYRKPHHEFQKMLLISFKDL